MATTEFLWSIHMPRAKGSDLCEIFGYAPDDTTDVARKQWKSQECPFVGGTCIKHSHPQNGKVVVYGTCSVVNKTRAGTGEEIILCAQRLYADNYRSLHAVINDATQLDLPFYLAHEYLRAVIGLGRIKLSFGTATGSCTLVAAATASMA
jgi:hypothetical protein